jgi:hypothetical protein
MGFVQAILSAVLKLVLGVAGLAFFLLAAAFALFAGVVVMLIGLVRGRPPRVQVFRMPPRPRWGGAARRAPPGDIVEAEVREVREGEAARGSDAPLPGPPLPAPPPTTPRDP